MTAEMNHRNVILQTGCATERVRRLERRADLLRDTARCALGVAVLIFGIVALGKGSDAIHGLTKPTACPPATITSWQSPLHRADLALIENLKRRLLLERKIGAQWSDYADQVKRQRNELARRLMRHERDL